MERKIVAVILAAGYGRIREGVSKLVERLNGTSIINHTLAVLERAGLKEKLMVLNAEFAEQVVNSLDFSIDRLCFQAKRRGPAQAVASALPTLRRMEATDILVVFGDMPMLCEASLKAIIGAHLQAENNVLTVSSWPFDPGHPLAEKMFNYAYLDMRREANRYPPTPIAVIYNGMPHAESAVLSSVYAINLAWFEQALADIPPYDKGDGYGPELHLPYLVNVALLQHRNITNITEPRPEPLIGVNTPEDLRLIRSILETEGGRS